MSLARPVALALASLAVGLVTVPALASGLGTGDAVTAPCRALSVTAAAGCENWGQDWTGPDEHSVFLPATEISDDGKTLVEAGTSLQNSPFARASVIARNGTTGQIEWKRGWLDPYPYEIEVVSDVAVGPEDERVYIGGETTDGSGFLLSLGVANGLMAWKNTSVEEVDAIATGEDDGVFVGGELVLNGERTDAVWRLNSSTGETEWVTATAGSPGNVVKLANGPLVTEEATPRIVGLDPADGHRRWTVPTKASDGSSTAVIEMGAAPDGSAIATVEAYPCGPGDGAPLVRLVEANGTEAWSRLGKCVERGTTASPVFVDADSVVVPVAYVPILTGTPTGSVTSAPGLNVTAYDVTDGEERWDRDRPAPPNREIIAGEARASLGGDRVYVSGSLTSTRPMPGENPTEDAYILARIAGCIATSNLPTIPRSSLLQGYDQALDCQRRPGWASFVAGFDSETGDPLGRLVDEGPFHAEGSQLEVSSASGDVLVSGLAADEKHERRFRTVSWPADAWSVDNSPFP